MSVSPAVPIKTCSHCPATLHRQNKIGICRNCYRKHRPEHIRKKHSDAIKRVYATRPEYLELHRRARVAYANTPEHKAAASKRAKESRIWEAGHRALTPEIIARRAAKGAATRLAAVPVGYRDLYRELRRKRLPIDEAVAACVEQERVDLVRWRASVGATAA